MELDDDSAADLALRMAPLLHRIAAEVHERQRAVGALRDHLSMLDRERRDHAGEIGLIEARLALALCELARAHAEARRLGWELVASRPTRVVYRGEGRAHGQTFELTPSGPSPVPDDDVARPSRTPRT